VGNVFDITGRRVRFELRSGGGDAGEGTLREFEVVTGNVQNTARQALYLPVGKAVCNVNTFGKVVTFTFQGALILDNLPWEEVEPMTQIRGLYVTANRSDPRADPDEPEEVYHYSEYAQAVSLTHIFDTTTHQIFDCVIMADGHYEQPQFLF